MFNLLSKSYVLQPRVGAKFAFRKSTELFLSTQKPGPTPIVVDEKDLRETFVRGSGPGGQKINKSKNNVHLVHIPTGIVVQCQETRDLASNRKIARKLLRDKIDLATNGEDSKLGRKFEKIRKKKRTSARCGIRLFSFSTPLFYKRIMFVVLFVVRRASKKYAKDENGTLSESSDEEGVSDGGDTEADANETAQKTNPAMPPNEPILQS